MYFFSKIRDSILKMCLLINFYFMHLNVYLHVHKQTTYMPGACGGKVSVLSYHMRAGNRTLGPQQVPPVFLTDKPSLQPYKGLLFNNSSIKQEMRNYQ